MNTHPRAARRIVVIVALAGLGAASCSSSGTAAKTSAAAGSHVASTHSTATAVAASSASATGNFCARFTAAEVGAIVKATVKAGTDAAHRCAFTSSGPTATLVESPPLAAANGGYAAAKLGATAGIKGTARDIGGLGDKAFVEAGTAAGSPIAEGAVQIDGYVIEATVDGGTGTPQVLGTELEALLRLAGGRA